MKRIAVVALALGAMGIGAWQFGHGALSGGHTTQGGSRDPTTTQVGTSAVRGAAKLPTSGVALGAPNGGGAPRAGGAEAANALLAREEANRQSVVEAARTGRFPERLSAMVPPARFDRDAYEADPDGYLNVVEPGRVWQTAEGGEGVKTLSSVGVAYREVDPGGSVALEVKGEAGAPVTFTSFDMGAFENKLASITVRAGADGVARAVFTATKGTVESVRVLAGSPLSTGQVRFVVQVSRS